MPDRFAELNAKTQALSPQECVRTEEALSASPDPHMVELEAACDEELRRRIDEIERGAVELVPASRAFAQVRRALGR